MNLVLLLDSLVAPLLSLPLATPPAAPLAAAPGAQSAGAKLPVAVLESGKRVPISGTASPGDRVFETPYGRFETPGDPVSEIADAAKEAEMLRRVRAADFKAWLGRASSRGLVGELVVAVEEGTLDEESQHAVLDALETWGARFDPVPAKVDADKRIDWLWARVEQAGAAEGALLTGSLVGRIPGAHAPFDRRLTLTDLRRGLRSKEPVVRRAAAVVARHQDEMDMRIPLVQASLTDPVPAVRLAAAQGTNALDHDQAIGRWFVAALRAGEESERFHAVDHMGLFGSAATVKPLIYALAASSVSRPPGSTIFVGRQISYVADFDVEVAQAAVIADPVVSTVVEGVAMEVRVISTTMSRRVMGALHRLTGEDPGPREQDWLRWWRETRMAAN